MNAGFRILTVASVLVLSATGSAAQSSSAAQEKPKESVAEVARRARTERERKAVAQAVREYTNDTLPPARYPGSSESGSGASTGDSRSAAGGAAAAPASEADEKERSEAEGALKDEKEKLANLKGQLDLLERETKLNKAAFYGKPDSANDKAGAANLAAQDAAIAAKKNEITETETKIKELDDKSKTINDRLGPRPEEPQTPEQQRGAWAEKLRPLREEMAKIDAELAAIQQERLAQGSTTNPPGAFTADRIAQLQRRRGELQKQIGDIEEDARRAGTLPIRN